MKTWRASCYSLEPSSQGDCGRSRRFGLLFAAIALFASIGLSSCASQSSAAANATNLSAGNSLSDPPGANFNSGHGATLSWNASNSSDVVGYNVYRGTESGGPYAKVNTSMVAATSYTDSAVQAGQTYYYLVTAVSSSNMESTYSNEVVASVP